VGVEANFAKMRALRITRVLPEFASLVDAQKLADFEIDLPGPPVEFGRKAPG